MVSMYVRAEVGRSVVIIARRLYRTNGYSDNVSADAVVVGVGAGARVDVRAQVPKGVE